MKKKLKILLYLVILIVLFYEGYYYINFRANSYLGVKGGELNRYKSDFVLVVNNKNFDTINVNIPYSFSKGVNLCLGKNTIKMNSLDSKIKFEKDVYFYGFFTWNIIEVTSKELIFSRHYSVPIIE